MPTSPTLALFSVLRSELADLACALERRGRHDAADITMMIWTRAGELAAGSVADVKIEPRKSGRPGPEPSGLFVEPASITITTHS